MDQTAFAQTLQFEAVQRSTLGIMIGWALDRGANNLIASQRLRASGGLQGFSSGRLRTRCSVLPQPSLSLPHYY
jgi:hypothetical protein